MVLDKATPYQPLLPKTSHFPRDIAKAQEIIYTFLLEIVRDWPPETVLEEFKHLFIHHSNTISSSTIPCLYEIVFSSAEQEFHNTLKRSCYILINNWELTRQHHAIQALIQLFNDPIIAKPTLSPTLQRLRNWLKAFTESQDFEDLKLFASRHYDRDFKHWSERYTSYLLVPQYIDLNNPPEQRQAAMLLAKQLKDRFKLELAMYTARHQSTRAVESLPRNPTSLGDEVLRLIKVIVARRGRFSYTNLANIFIQQTRHLTYREFKASLQSYLFFALGNHDVATVLKEALSERITTLYSQHEDRPVDEALILRTCNRLVEWLTTENGGEPSSIFVLALSRGTPLTLVITLVKIILICRHVRMHLEARIADLIRHYENLSEDECQWVVNFFEVFRVTAAIYTENVEFNLVNMMHDRLEAHRASALSAHSIDGYRIFSQPKVTIAAQPPQTYSPLSPIDEAHDELHQPTSDDLFESIAAS
jgi:hypothetical protein